MFLQMKSAASAGAHFVVGADEGHALVDALGVDEDHADALRLGLVDDGGERVRVGRRDGERVDALGELVLDLADLRLHVAFLRRREHDEVDAELRRLLLGAGLDRRPERIAGARPLHAAGARSRRCAAAVVEANGRAGEPNSLLHVISSMFDLLRPL